MGVSTLSEKRLIPSAAMRDKRESIPVDWSFVSVKEIAATRANAIVGGPFGSDLVSKDYVSVGVPVIRGQNMARHYISGDFAFVSPGKAKQLQANTARAGDVIFTQRGTLGQVSLVPAAPFDEYVVSQSQMKLELNARKASAEYVYQYFVSAQGQKQIIDSAIQTGVPHTNLGILQKYEIPFPPTLREQEAIGEALSDADVLIESLSLLLTKKRQVKQGAMQELLTGRRRLPGFTGSWTTKSLAALARIQRGASPRPIDDPKWFDDSSQVGWVRISDVTQAGMHLEVTVQRLSAAGVRHSRPVAPGSLIMSICATVGKPIITAIETCIHDGFVVFEDLQVEQRFLYYALLAIEQDWARHGQSGSQMNLNTGLINRTEIAVPPTKEEQRAISQAFADMDADIAAIESRLKKACDLKQGMMQKLLTGRIRLVRPASKLSRALFSDDNIASAIPECRTLFNR